MSFFVHVGCSFWAHLFYRLFLSYRILFTIYAKNGGTVDYIGREDSHGYVRPGSYSINGIIKQSTTFEIEIDFQQPSHCYETQTNCADDALTTRNDFLKQVNIFRLVLRKLSIHFKKSCNIEQNFSVTMHYKCGEHIKVIYLTLKC